MTMARPMFGLQKKLSGSDKASQAVATQSGENEKTKRILPDNDHPDEYYRFRRLQLQDEKGQIPAHGWIKAQEHIRLMKDEQEKRMKTLRNSPKPLAAGIRPDSWSWLGPGNVGGRIRSIVIHPTNPGTIWVGSVGGGIWRTNDAGLSWFPVNDFMANLAISTMVIDPTNSNILYAGTGERFTPLDGLRGFGVFKSTDGGSTWNLLSSTNPNNLAGCGGGGPNCPWSYVNRLAVSRNGSTILAATINSIWRSTDGGNTWSQGAAAAGGALFGEFIDVKFHPTDSLRAVASVYGGAFYSTDGGATWASSNFSLPLGGNCTPPSPSCTLHIELAYAPSFQTPSQSWVYAIVDEYGGDLFRSTDGGISRCASRSSVAVIRTSPDRGRDPANRQQSRVLWARAS